MQLKHGVQGQTGEGELSSATESSKDTSSWAPTVQTDLWQIHTNEAKLLVT